MLLLPVCSQTVRSADDALAHRRYAFFQSIVRQSPRKDVGYYPTGEISDTRIFFKPGADTELFFLADVPSGKLSKWALTCWKRVNGTPRQMWRIPLIRHRFPTREVSKGVLDRYMTSLWIERPKRLETGPRSIVTYKGPLIRYILYGKAGYIGVDVLLPEGKVLEDGAATSDNLAKVGFLTGNWERNYLKSKGKWK